MPLDVLTKRAGEREHGEGLWLMPMRVGAEERVSGTAGRGGEDD